MGILSAGRLLGGSNAGFSPASLFAAGEVGAWYDPSDFSTMFQNSTGVTPVTAVEQPVGLILDKSNGASPGAELVSNGTFTSNTTGWSSGFGVTTSTFTATGGNGVLTIAGADTAPRYVTTLAGLTVGSYYKLSFNVVGFTGTGDKLFVWTSVANGTAGVTINQTPSPVIKAYTFYVTATATTMYFAAGFNASAAGDTFTIDNVSIVSVPGNHATQATAASRPVLSARVNLLTYSEQFDNAAWGKNACTVTANAAIDPFGGSTADAIVENTGTVEHYISSTNATYPDGSLIFSLYLKANGRTQVFADFNTVNAAEGRVLFDLSAVTATAVFGTTARTITSVGNGWYYCTMTGAPGAGIKTVKICLGSAGSTSYTGNGVSGAYIWGADLRVTNQGVGLPAYQRVVTSTNYDTTGFPLYLKFDGVDDSLATGTITPGVGKAQVFAGVRKLTDAAYGVIAEWGVGATGANNLGLFVDTASTGKYYIASGGGATDGTTNTITVVPNTDVAVALFDRTGATGADRIISRVDGVSSAITFATQTAQTGNFSAAAMNIGRRSDTTLPFNGNLYGLIVRFSSANLDAAQITNTETWVNGKTKAY